MIIKFNGFCKYSFIILGALMMLLTQSVLARVHEYETTRLKSTGGTGVGSILMNESLLLNPAPLALFNVTTITYQRDDVSLVDRNPSRASSPNSFNGKSHNNGYFFAEGTNKVKGAFAYLDQSEGKDSRQRFSTALGFPVSDTLALGTGYRYTRELSHVDRGDERFNYSTITLGLTHIIEPNFTMGLMIEDPTKSKAKRTRGIFGIQYVAKDLITLMADVGSDYNKDLADGLVTKVATQIKLISDFYLRAGVFQDKLAAETGNGWGLGWVGPKLVLDFGMKSTKPKTDPSPQLLSGEKLKEMTLSLSYIFDNN